MGEDVHQDLPEAAEDEARNQWRLYWSGVSKQATFWGWYFSMVCLGFYRMKFQESQILREVSVFGLASHLLWTLWSLKQAQNSNIPFAYYSFASDRLEDYIINNNSSGGNTANGNVCSCSLNHQAFKRLYNKFRYKLLFINSQHFIIKKCDKLYSLCLNIYNSKQCKRFNINLSFVSRLGKI